MRAGFVRRRRAGSDSRRSERLRCLGASRSACHCLRSHHHGTAPDGRLFPGTRGGMLSESADLCRAKTRSWPLTSSFSLATLLCGIRWSVRPRRSCARSGRWHRRRGRAAGWGVPCRPVVG